MAGIDRVAAVRFLETAFGPQDWIAIFLKSYDTKCVVQRVGSMSWIQSERFQRWLRAMNSGRYSVFVSVNTIISGRRSRTRDAIGAVRHVFLDADDDGSRVLSCVDARRDLPPLSYVLHTSPSFHQHSQTAPSIEKRCRCGGSIESISVERDSLRKERLLKPLLIIERSLHPQV